MMAFMKFFKYHISQVSLKSIVTFKKIYIIPMKR